ncbi:MAG: DoxX family protein [Fimbriimonadaceae bacterium]|nr:DoxX family protein [Chitinophagales bacterium]
MKPKIIRILYWIFTILFAGFMIFSAIPDVAVTEPPIDLMHDSLGYPVYIICFIGIAKLLGAIAILIPGLARIKS